MRALILSTALFFPAALFAQPKPVTPPLQTAREALIEMITGGETAINKHLTVEVQDLLHGATSGNGASFTTMLRAWNVDSGAIQVPPSGPVLFTTNNPESHTKTEVRIENDDLDGDEDSIELSVHSFKDGQEQRDAIYSVSRFTITMKKQQNIWRLSKVALGMEFPVGDAEFVKKTFLMASAGALANTAEPKDASSVPGEPRAAFDPSSTIVILASAEQLYANMHPDIGFTCALQNLTDPSDLIGLKAQLNAGSSTYRFHLTGCEGKPAGSFQATIEPIAASAGTQAFCTDATRNVRVSEDGSGSNCLSSGKPYHFDAQPQQEGLGAVSGAVDIHVHSETPKQ